jgi:hypothetical protein
MTQYAFQNGYVKAPPAKRSREGRDQYIAFDYLALYQVCGWTCQRIAQEFDNQVENITLRAEAVMEQIHWAADAIELELKPAAKPGRPRENNR